VLVLVSTQTLSQTWPVKQVGGGAPPLPVPLEFTALPPLVPVVPPAVFEPPFALAPLPAIEPNKPFSLEPQLAVKTTMNRQRKNKGSLSRLCQRCMGFSGARRSGEYPFRHYIARGTGSRQPTREMLRH
jgi:hypothetical protein